MKKLLLMVAAVAALAFAACSKEENKTESLVGTAWEFFEAYNDDGNIEYYSAQLQFTTGSEVKITESYGNGVEEYGVETAIAKYTYNHPAIFIHDNEIRGEMHLVLEGDGRLYWSDEALYFVKK